MVSSDPANRDQRSLSIHRRNSRNEGGLRGRIVMRVRGACSEDEHEHVSRARSLYAPGNRRKLKVMFSPSKTRLDNRRFWAESPAEELHGCVRPDIAAKRWRQKKRRFWAVCFKQGFELSRGPYGASNVHRCLKLSFDPKLKCKICATTWPVMNIPNCAAFEQCVYNLREFQVFVAILRAPFPF